MHFSESSKLVEVCLHSDQSKELNGISLRNIPNTKLWEKEVCIQVFDRSIPYHFSLKCRAFITIPVPVLRQFLEKSLMYETTTNHLFPDSEMEFQVPLPSELFDGYVSHCSYILESVSLGNESESIKQIRRLEVISNYLTTDQKACAIKKMIQLMQGHFSTWLDKKRSVVFVFFLSHKPSVALQDILPSEFAISIFYLCSSAPNEWIPVEQKTAFFSMLEKVNKCAFQENANFISFCVQMHPQCDADMCSKLLSIWRSSADAYNQLLPNDPKQAKHILKECIKQLSGNEHYESSKVVTFLEKLQRQLPFDYQILVFDELKHSASKSISLEILESTCERRLNKLSKEGKLADIVDEIEKILHCRVVSIETIRERAEQSLLGSFDKVSKSSSKTGHKKLKELIVNGNLFCETGSKIKLMEKCSESFDRDIHSLVAFCLTQEHFHDVPNDEIKRVVLKWFEQASKHHCGAAFSRNELSDSLVKLYTFVGDMHLNPWLFSHDELLNELDTKAYKCLKRFDVVDILKAIPKMEKFEDDPVEDIFKNHIQKLLKDGLDSGDITKQDLIGQTKTCVVNSK